MDPHIRTVSRRDAVAEPLVPALVNDDEVKSRAYAYPRPVAFEVSIDEMVPVGNSALMLHAGVGHLHQLIAIFLEGIIAEVVLESAEHRFYLCELFFGLVYVFGQRVEIHG